MSELLTKLENALEEVESQLLAEFERIRKTLSAEAYSPIDPGVKTALNEVVIHLWQELEHSGDESNLTLRTEHHEAVADRIIVIKKLLDARIPTAYLQEAEDQLGSAQRTHDPATKTPTEKQTQKPKIIIDEKKGLLESIRDFLGKKTSEPQDGIRVNDQGSNEQDAVSVYNDDGVYAPGKKLAEIAGRFKTSGDDREMMNAVIRGKAVFESRDVSEVLTEKEVEENSADPQITGASVFDSREISNRKHEPATNDSEIAKTPDAIRRKLEKATRRSNGASTFGARDLSNTPAPVAVKAEPKIEKPKKKKSVAQTPEEIRKKLEARQSDSTFDGKASFNSKEIKHAAPQEFRARPEKKKTPEPETPVERPTGKAVFEVKDLTKSPTDK